MISDYSTARSPIPWFGGKQRLAEHIIAEFAPHEVYVEVFGGGGSVLLSKARTKLDVYNDADDGLVNFFRCLRDQPEKLLALLELTLDDHQELVSRLLELRGDFAISGYDSDVYGPLEACGGRRVEWDTVCTAAAGVQGQPRRERTEVLWLSTEASHGRLFDVA